MSDAVSRETKTLAQIIERQLQEHAEGNRKIVRHAGTLCCRCHTAPPVPGGGYCAECRKAYDQNRRKTAADELTRLRALEKQLSEGKDDDASEQTSKPPLPTPS